MGDQLPARRAYSSERDQRARSKDGADDGTPARRAELSVISSWLSGRKLKERTTDHGTVLALDLF